MHVITYEVGKREFTWEEETHNIELTGKAKKQQLNLLQMCKICIQLACIKCIDVPSFITLVLIANQKIRHTFVKSVKVIYRS